MRKYILMALLVLAGCGGTLGSQSPIQGIPRPFNFYGGMSKEQRNFDYGYLCKGDEHCMRGLGYRTSPCYAGIDMNGRLCR